MIPENKIFLDSNDIACVVRVIVSEMLKNLDFYSCLLVKPLLVPNYFDPYILFLLVVEAFYSLSKTSSTQIVKGFISICYMIMKDQIIITSLFIISIIVFIGWRSFNFICIETQKVDFFVI
jgi:hypothetical protein